MTEIEPALPYNGTAGYVDVDTSHETAIHEAVTGIASKTQRYVLIILGQRKARGATIGELRETTGSLHHGKISGALSDLHKVGKVVALRERRGRAGVYVLPEYVEGRETRPFHRNRAPQIDRAELVKMIDDMLINPAYQPEDAEWVEVLADQIIERWGK